MFLIRFLIILTKTIFNFVPLILWENEQLASATKILTSGTVGMYLDGLVRYLVWNKGDETIIKQQYCFVIELVSIGVSSVEWIEIQIR